MIRDGRIFAHVTGYINNIYYSELFTYKLCRLQDWSLFYWFKNSYQHRENFIWSFQKRS
nr:MAG TPA: hypothetical protein [Caudoviricetes sp.]